MAKRSGRPTIIDVAREAGVSFKTVSRVLNNNPHVADELRERVRAAAKALDYRANIAARALAGPRNYTFALLFAIHLRNIESQDDWYLPAFLSDLQFAAVLACQRAGYHLSIELCDVSEDAPPLALPPNVTREAFDGVIVAPPLCDRQDIIDALDAEGIRYVPIAPGLDIETVPSVAVDEYGGAAAMTRHLLDLGHRRIAFVRGPDGHKAATARMRAYCDVLADHDATLEPMIETGVFNFQSGFAAAEKLLKGAAPPTAIFCSNDDMAAGAIAAAMRLGLRVPEQLSIAGFDDSAVAHLTSPPLTTVRQSFADMATAAVQLLVAGAGETGPAAQQSVVLPYKIVMRGSTGPAPGGR